MMAGGVSGTCDFVNPAEVTGAGSDGSPAVVAEVIYLFYGGRSW